MIGTRGNFFAIHRERWHEVCGSGFYEALTYLTLAAFSGGDNVTTCASVKATETHTGAPRKKAKDCIEKLIAERFIRKIEDRKPKQPQYKIILNKSSTVQKECATDYEEDLIWLPTEIVTGAKDEKSPLARLRETQDVLTLRLFIDLYFYHDLVSYCGVNTQFVCKDFIAKLLGEHGKYNVWSYKQNAEISIGPIAAHLSADNNADIVLERIETLQDLGLVEFIPHLMDGNRIRGKALHPLSSGKYYRVELADMLGNVSHEAGMRMLFDDQQSKVENHNLKVLPMLRHFKDIHIIGVMIMTYRPKTSKTAEWKIKEHTDWPEYYSQYQAIADNV